MWWGPCRCMGCAGAWAVPVPPAARESLVSLRPEAAVLDTELSHSTVVDRQPVERCGHLEYQLKDLRLGYNKLTGDHLRSTNRASDPSRTCACSAAVHDRRFGGA